MKTYLRYEETSGTGIICSNRSSSILIRQGRRLVAITPGYEAALAWDVMRGELRARFEQRKSMDGEITCLAVFNLLDQQDQASVNGTLVAGRAKGRVDLHSFNAASFLNGAPNVEKNTAKPRASLAGHASAVTCANFSKDGSRLATGSSDTFVIVWDVLTETGLFRLRGHKDEVTSVRFCDFLENSIELVSSSKDTTLKLWDLEAQHCESTLADHPNGVWCVATSDFAARKRIYTGSSDGLLRSYDALALDSIMPGSANRQTSQRAETMQICGDILAIQSAGKLIEFHRLRSAERASKKLKRRLKRLREKNKDISAEDERMWTQDEVELACVLRTPFRARSVSMCQMKDGEIMCLITYTNNLAETYAITTEEAADDDDVEGDGEPQAKKKAKTSETKLKSTLELVSRIELQGHRTDIRCVDLGEEDELAITAADGAVKLWNVASGACLRTMPSGFSLCCAFSPLSLHSIVGTQEGKLLVHNLSDGSVSKEIESAHNGESVFSLDIHPDGTELVTCGGDKQCKFWSLKVGGANNKEMELAHVRTLRLGEEGDAQCVRYTRGGKKANQFKVCVGMLDSTVKIFHEDSLEFHLSLYGHKLPVLSMDASDDGAILATGSADKTIKIWGLDFGDCHRSVFAHDGSVTSIRFVPKTHYLVSCGRDGKVRYWDCDSNMERILSFDYAHYGDAFGVAIATDGSFFLSAGKDKRVRRYDRTKDIVFIEEEREKEIDETAEEEREATPEEGRGDQAIVAANANAQVEESLSVNKRTMQSIEVTDKLIDCLLAMTSRPPSDDSGEEEDEESYLERIGVALAKVARSAPTQDLSDALVYLPAVHVRSMLIGFAFALKARVEVETVTKAALTLIKIHGPRLISAKDRDAVELLKTHMRKALWEVRDLIGTNAAGLRAMQRSIELQSGSFRQAEETGFPGL